MWQNTFNYAFAMKSGRQKPKTSCYKIFKRITVHIKKSRYLYGTYVITQILTALKLKKMLSDPEENLDQLLDKDLIAFILTMLSTYLLLMRNLKRRYLDRAIVLIDYSGE